MQNRHHIWYPRRDYKTPTERAFRSLPCFIVWLDVEAHKLLHVHQRPPSKPKHDEMVAAIDRHKQQACACYAGERIDQIERLFGERDVQSE